MKTRGVLFISLLLLSACADKNEALLQAPEQEHYLTSHSATHSIKEGRPNEVGQIEVTVEAEKVPCMGMVPMQCLVVDGELFYEQIQGFEFESGYRYKLHVERKQRFDEANAPVDVSLYEYRLIAVLEKRKP